MLMPNHLQVKEWRLKGNFFFVISNIFSPDDAIIIMKVKIKDGLKYVIYNNFKDDLLNNDCRFSTIDSSSVRNAQI